jgi:hypothetical protein
MATIRKEVAKLSSCCEHLIANSLQDELNPDEVALIAYYVDQLRHLFDDEHHHNMSVETAPAPTVGSP